MIGLLFSLLNIEIPSILSSPLHMLGRTTSVVAIFMLGVFLYGRKYENLRIAFGLSLLRMALLPLIAFLITMLFYLSKMEIAIIILMNSMPMAISMMVLSNRYKFYEDTIASVILISSLGAIVYLNIWLFILGL